jgi:hypothetical protein
VPGVGSTCETSREKIIPLHKTKHPGVYFINGKDPFTGKPGNIIFSVYRNQERKQVEYKAGHRRGSGTVITTMKTP